MSKVEVRIKISNYSALMGYYLMSVFIYQHIIILTDIKINQLRTIVLCF